MSSENKTVTPFCIGISVGIASGLIAGWLLRGRTRVNLQKIASLIRHQNQCKMVLVVRSDLNMSQGKIAAQVSHAAVDIFRRLKHSEILELWLFQGMPKVVLRTESEASLLELYEKACDLNLPVSLIRDAGRTQIKSGSATCIGVGPATPDIVDKVTGHLKLY